MLRRLSPAIVAALAAVLISVGSVTADGGQRLVNSTMVGIPTAGMTLLGVPGGGLPWTLDSGSAVLRADGRLHVEVEHLVLASGANAGTNPIPTGVAIVACGGGTTLITTAAVPFSPAGDAEVEATVSLPSPCLAPVVFFAGVTGAGPRWFAVTGG